MTRPVQVLIALVGLLAAATGCGTQDVAPAAIDFLPGAEVGKLAEEQLEEENPTMAVGSMSCPDLDWAARASVRCMKTSELSEGRRVKIPGTVTVTSLEDGGRLHVALDDRVAEFGLDGEHLGGAVRTWAAARSVDVTSSRCPYLLGSPGTRVRCTVVSGDAELGVLVTVTETDPRTFRTRYSLRWEAAGRVPKASPTFVAPNRPSVVD